MKHLKLVVFDLDGTLTVHKTGSWEAISERFGCLPRFEELKQQYSSGVIDADAFTSTALALWKGQPKRDADAAAVAELQLLPGVRELGNALRQHGVAVAMVTGSVEASALAAAQVLGVPDDMLVCNKLHADEAGALTGSADLWSTKDECTRDLARRAGVDLCDTCFVGDSGNDVPAFAVCGHSLAVNSANRRVLDAAEHCANDVVDARQLLPLLLPPAHVVWIRHGHGYHNELADRIGIAAYSQPIFEPALTARGKQQCLDTRRALQADSRGLWPADRVYCSPLRRCIETASFVLAREEPADVAEAQAEQLELAGAGQPFLLDDRLIERLLDPCNERAARSEIVERWTTRRVDAARLWREESPKLDFREPIAAVAERVQSATADILRELRPGDVVYAVAHYEAIKWGHNRALSNGRYFVTEHRFDDHYHALLCLPAENTPAAAALLDDETAQPARRAQLVDEMARCLPTGVHPGEEARQWDAFLDSLRAAYEQLHKQEAAEAAETPLEQQSEGQKSKAFAQRMLRDSAEALEPRLALIGCRVDTPLSLIARAYHAQPCRPLNCTLKSVRAKAERLSRTIAMLANPTSREARAIRDAGKALHKPPEEAEARLAELIEQHAARLRKKKEFEQRLLKQLREGGDPEAAAYEDVHCPTLSRVVGVWDRAVRECDAERAQRGRGSFESRAVLERAALLAMRRLGMQRARVVTGARWQHGSGSTDEGGAEGRVGAVLLGENDRVVALLEFKEQCFDVEAADHQLRPGVGHEPRMLKVQECCYKVRAKTPRFVVTTVPPKTPVFCFPSAMRRPLSRIFDPANTPEIEAAEKARVYRELCGQYRGRITPLEWMKRFGENRCLVIV